MTRFASWNVNGLRACAKKGFFESFAKIDADVFAIQETKMQEGQLDVVLPEYAQYYNSAEKKGYSGTAVFSRIAPLSVYSDFDAWRSVGGIVPDGFESEGRIITLEFENAWFVNVYVPNAQRELTRLSYRMEWEDVFRTFLLALAAKKPVIVCGDMNVAHNEIDIKNARSNRGNAGFTDEEREKMTKLLSCGFTDSFRFKYPDTTDAYTWWSYMGHAREKNVGWRIDYFIVSSNIADSIQDAIIYPEIMGSDHCPVVLDIDMHCIKNS